MRKTMYCVLFTIILYSSLVTALTQADNDKTKMADVTQQKNDQGSIDDVDVEEIMNKCNESFRIDMVYLKALNESGSFPDETDKTPKCYLRCVLENTAIMSKDGEFDSERTAVLFAGERLDKAMEGIQDMATACSNRKETCKCERAYNYLKCLMSMEIEKYQSKN